MDFGDIGPYASLGPFGVAVAMLIRDNIRLRTEASGQRKAIDRERQGRFDAEERAEKAEARNAGLEERIGHLEQRVAYLTDLIEKGSGHA